MAVRQVDTTGYSEAIVDANGHTLTTIPGAGTVAPWVAPSWSPDGSKVAYATGDASEPTDGASGPMDLHTQAPTAGAVAGTVVTGRL